METKIIEILLKLVNKAYKKEETPVAAVILYNNKIIAKSYNKRNKTNKTIDHAEILAIQKANKKLKSWRLNKCSMYVTIKPCDMCMDVIREARISKVYYLVNRLEEKKIYNKTEVIPLDSKEVEHLKKVYLKKITNFWKNKRI
ncbi:MAG: deaminase [Bacilli bacterium]|nr:deaminase [Bacilli bacterium]MDD3895668.1 deaminase [Bacilli bacterium]MDD4407479.1 deaminase [Bacilli bacterium]